MCVPAVATAGEKSGAGMERLGRLLSIDRVRAALMSASQRLAPGEGGEVASLLSSCQRSVQ